MKYFIVSDVHSYYDELITALNGKGFDKNNRRCYKKRTLERIRMGKCFLDKRNGRLEKRFCNSKQNNNMRALPLFLWVEPHKTKIQRVSPKKEQRLRQVLPTIRRRRHNCN